MKDARQAEAWYLIAISSVVAAAIILQFMIWSLWHEEITNHSQTATWYWWVQLGTAVLIVAGGFIGYCPGVRVVFTGSSIRVSQGIRSVELDMDSVIDYSVIPALRYYRKWDGRVESYMTHIPEDVLLVHGEQEAIAIGVDSHAHALLVAALNRFKGTEVTESNAV